MNRSCEFDPDVCSIRIKQTLEIPFNRYGDYRNFRLSQPRYIGCGSPIHALLSSARTRSGSHSKRYSCPVIAYDEPLYNEFNTCLQINCYACPHKFAEFYKYCINVIERRIPMMIWCGGFTGPSVSRHSIELFRTEVLRICHLHHMHHNSPDRENERLIPNIQNS